MPELPEVEVLCRRLQTCLPGRKILRIQSAAARQIHPNLDALMGLVGQTILTATRRGKLIYLVTSEKRELVFHLRMSGLVHCSTESVEAKHTRLMLEMAGDLWLRFDDPRRFGGAYVGPPFPSYIVNVAADPLAADFDLEAVVLSALRSRRRIKSWLLDQMIMSGVGNIYADEALYRAKIHPQTPSQKLGEPRTRRLISEVQQILRRAIELDGSSIDWAFKGGRMQHELLVYGRHGRECRHCGTILKYHRINKRSTTWCPTCQK